MRSRTWNELRRWISPDPNRREYNERFLQHLNSQARTLHLPGALISLIGWLGFAFDTDRKLHPEFPELLYFRLGLTALGAVVLIVILLDRLGLNRVRGAGRGWLLAMIAYGILATSFFTGRIADDPNYVSGLQIAIILAVLLPLTARSIYWLYAGGLVLFLTAVYIYSPDLSSDQAAYSMQNLIISSTLGLIMAYIMDRLRFTLFYNNVRVEEQMAAVRKLKENQDGDYFLTANLLAPLIENHANVPGVRVDFLLRQNKTFQFRNWRSEIGGDYLSAHTVHLRDREYTAFINGDAMGKSIQGAGGALVLGTVFRSLISRTHTAVETAGKSPERWLKDCFVELQDVFVTFDGRMLISAVVGLLDNQSGLTYFINAEHPWSVLYRNEHAEFIEDELEHRKIGIVSPEGTIRVSVFAMQPGDALILGSDGRDDLIVGTDADGRRMLNEDENAFLRHVQSARGELEDILSALKSSGELSDDLSLMRICFREDAAAPELAPPDALSDSRAQELRDSARTGARQGDYAAAVRSVETLCAGRPAEWWPLFAASKYLKLLYIDRRDPALISRAIDYGERARLRDPRHTNNIVNLADLYRLAGDDARARKRLAAALEYEPDHATGLKLRGILDRDA